MSSCHLGVPWRQTEDFLNDIGSMSIGSSHYHSQTLLNEDLSKFNSESLVLVSWNDVSNFTVQELAEYVDKKFHEFTG
jgi:hypothetical protein